MKKIYLMLCLSGAFSCVSAQQTFEAGLVLRTGNFTLTSGNTQVSNGYDIKITESKWSQPGMMYVFGGYQKLYLGKRFALSAELLFRYAAYVMMEEYLNEFPSASSFYNNDSKYSVQVGESSLSLPVRLHMSFREYGRTSVAVGAGISRILAIDRMETTSTQYTTRDEGPYHSTAHRFNNNAKEFRCLMTLTAGVQHRIGERSTVGLDFSFEPDRKVFEDYYNNQFSNIFCGVAYQPIQLPSLKSFSVTLQHNLLR